MSGRKTMRLASRGRRFASACIDMAIPFVAYIIMSVALAGAGRMNPGYGYGFGNDFGYGYGFDYGYGYGFGMPFVSRGTIALVVFMMLALIAFLVVQCVFYAKGRSIGKMILGLQVVSSVDGTPFRFWKMMLRECIVKQASAVLMLGYIWILIDDKNRGWHDKILDSYVVDLKESARLAQNRAPARAEEPVYREEPAYAEEPAYGAGGAAMPAEQIADAPEAIPEAISAEAPAELQAETEPQPAKDPFFGTEQGEAVPEVTADAAAPAVEVIPAETEPQPAEVQTSGASEAVQPEEPAAEMPKRPVIRLDD